MRTLYFDIDGTVLLNDHEGPKPCLAGGAFERGVRAARFDRLVCVGNFVDIVRAVSAIDSSYDKIGGLFAICRGVFSNESWFRRVITLVAEPVSRAAHVDLAGDWWYVDDLAQHYFQAAGLEAVFHRERGKRIMIPMPNGDGEDVLDWLGAIA